MITLEKETYLATADCSPDQGEIMTARMPEPIKKLLGHDMRTVRGILVRLGVLNLDLLKVVTSTLFQSLGKGTKRNE